MRFLQACSGTVKQFRSAFCPRRSWIVAVVLGMMVLILEQPHLEHRRWDRLGQPAITIAQPLENPGERRVHPIPISLKRWQSSQPQNHYFSNIPTLPLGYLVWSDRPVSIYVGPSHFTDSSRKQAWENSVQKAIADWQSYFPLERSDNPKADIRIEQVRPQRTSNGRIRSAQAIPKIYCEDDRLTHRFILQISPSQASRYIQAATRHELGHALGIWGHSQNPEDVMYKAQVRQPPEISERDLQTLKKIYAQPTLLGWPSPQYCPTSSPQASESTR